MEEKFPYPEKCSLTEGLTPAEFSHVLSCLNARVITLTKDQTLFRDGDPSGRVGVIVKGALRIERVRMDGRRVILETVGENRSFGSSYALTGKARMTVNVVAVRPSTVIVYDGYRSAILCRNACPFHAKFVHNILSLLSERNFVLKRKVRILSHRTVRDKLLVYLNMLSRDAGSDTFDIPYDRQGLADFLCVDRSALSAEISKLRAEHILESRKHAFKILKFISDEGRGE